jgi:hypothetical protein
LPTILHLFLIIILKGKKKYTKICRFLLNCFYYNNWFICVQLKQYRQISFYYLYKIYYFFTITFFTKINSVLTLPNLNFINFLQLYRQIYTINFWLNRSEKKIYKIWANSDYKQITKQKNIFFLNSINLIKNYFIIFFYFNQNNFANILNLNNLNFKTQFKMNTIAYLKTYKQTFGEGFFYIRGLILIFFIDACITDDEPLWEPIEWSLVQTWILFIFIFAWIAENLITSRYGSYTGRDKRVWFAWYKTFWLIDACYVISYGLTAIFIIVPFYYELTYSVSFIFSWWNWYTRVFFFKFISIYTIVLLIAYILQINIRWLNWKKLFLFTLIINFFIAYLLYTHFIMAFFGYFTDPVW